MLTGADLIPVDPSRFHTPHWVVLVAGLAFSSVGFISFLANHRETHPARYLFVVGMQHGWNYPLAGREGSTQPVYYLFFLSIGFSILSIVILVALGTGRLKR